MEWMRSPSDHGLAGVHPSVGHVFAEVSLLPALDKTDLVSYDTDTGGD